MIIDLTSMTTLTTLAVSVTTIGGAWLTIRKIVRDIARSRRGHFAEVLQSAKEADSSLKIKLEIKIHDLELQMSNFKENTEKDIKHLKETYSNEIKNLGEKIEDLRSELAVQHGSLLSLLTKLIDSND